LRITLKYDQTGRSVIEEIKRISKPGRRVYSSVDDLPYVLNGMGIAIISTSKGMMSDKSCRQAKIGGEIICTVR
jgi:small subunit ribosomal protein S8